MNRVETIPVAHTPSYAAHHRAQPRSDRFSRAAMLFAYAATGWVGLVGIVYLIATAL